MTPLQKGLLCGLLLAVTWPVDAVVNRSVGTVGEIVRVKGDEEVRFVDLPTWRAAEAEQPLAPGDTVRTGPFGGLAILFDDETQIRVHRNTLMVIKDIRRPDVANSTTSLQLLLGSVWTRAQHLLRRVTQREIVTMETPSATIGIRGTDWFASVDGKGTSTLIVLSGSARLFNSFGEVSVERGEVATAEIGKPPNKRVIIDIRDRPLIALEITLEWFDALSINGLPSQALKKLQKAPAPGNARQAVEQAEIAYDLHQYAATRKLLQVFDQDSRKGGDAAGELAARADLVRGLLQVRLHEYDAADVLFREAKGRLSGRARVMAELGLVATLIQRQRFTEAQDALERLVPSTSPYADVAMFQAVLLSFGGENAKALEVAEKAKARFGEDARIPALMSHLYFLIDDPTAMKASIDEALALDPDNQFAWHWRGLYYHLVKPNADLALESYRRSLEINPDFLASWNNLGGVQLELGDYEAADAALRRAMSVDPKVALPVAGYAILLSVLDRFAEADQQFEKALRIQPGQPESLLGKGYLLIQQGRPAEGAEQILKAIAADPSLPGAQSALAVAYYQAGRFEAAIHAVKQASDFDPDDPVAPLIGSIMAQDQARAGEAIEFAQEALRKARKFGTFAVDNVANTRSGESNIGSAYRNLRMDQWGAYYANVSFSPYVASGYFLLSDLYPSFSARQDSIAQGLLLDPLAVSAPTRYYEFLREPRIDPTLGGSAGNAGGAANYSIDAGIQGFARASNPIAYAASFAQGRNDGYRENIGSDDWAFAASAGTRFNDRKQNLLFSIRGERSQNGLPGLATNPDLDDQRTTEIFDASIGYHHRFAFDNRILAKVTAGKMDITTDNPVPYGTGFTNRDISFIRRFGLPATNALYALGLYDSTAIFGIDANNPSYLAGPVGALFGLTALPNTIPARFDTNPIRQRKLEDRYYNLQFRHLFSVDPVDLTYGFEWFPTNSQATTIFNGFSQLGTASLGLVIPFAFGTVASNSFTQGTDVKGAQAYVQGLWRISPSVSTEAGLFFRYLDRDGFGDQTQVDPRFGIGWQVSPAHWVRFAAQRELKLPLQPNGSLAPVSVLGLVVPDTYLNAGGESTILQARWDAEWTRRLFTFVSAEQQQIDGLVFTIPGALGSLFISSGVLRRLAVGANVWFGGNVGVFASFLGQWSENESAGLGNGKALPFIPEYSGQAGITWVHPSQVRINLSAAYTGKRWGDAANTIEMGSYWTANASVNWQPLSKHVSLTLGVFNLFDRKFEYAPGFPAPGRSVFLSGQYRF